MAYILRVRGNPDGAMQLYQQSLEIDERLGDLKGKAITLGMMGQLLIVQEEFAQGIQALVQSFQTLSSIGAQPDAQQVAEILAAVRRKIGAEKFDALWREHVRQPLPGWLAG